MWASEYDTHYQRGRTKIQDQQNKANHNRERVYYRLYHRGVRLLHVVGVGNNGRDLFSIGVLGARL